MKKVFMTFAGILALQSMVYGQRYTDSQDSLKNVQLEQVVVSATRAGKNTPMTYTDISQPEIKKNNAARNIPILLQNIPSLVSYGEDGTGAGYSYMRIRGVDASRINVTLNGMPLNNPESQDVFWINLPDLSNSLQSIQIQRGVGTSTNGSGAFGASISLKTVGARTEAYGEASTSAGSYNTFTSSIAAGTGILKNGLSFDARFSRNTGEGYIRNGFIDHYNLFTSLSHYTDNQLIRLSYIKGKQRTGITWEGVDSTQIEKNGRRYNPAGEYKDEAGRRRYYDNETDNYYSDIAQLQYPRRLNDAFAVNANLSYNHGFGYYENYIEDDSLKFYRVPAQVIDGVTHEVSDLIIQQKMDNDFYVANIGADYIQNNWKVNAGALYSRYNGRHFGKRPWIQYVAYPEKEKMNPDDIFENWYHSKARKTEVSVFAKAEYQWNDRLSLFGDLQYRHIHYTLKGEDKDFKVMDGDYRYDFLNPKAGVFFRPDERNSVYASVAVAQREPIRSDLKEGAKREDHKEPIRPERMIDYELGYRYNTQQGLYFGANIYYMDYHNQMVQTGKLDDVGYRLLENVKSSYRAGIELEASVPLFAGKWRLDANATFSRNKINDYAAYYDMYDANENPLYDENNKARQQKEEFESTDISFSPDVVSAVSLTYNPFSALYFTLTGKYIGKQYLDNTSNDSKSIPGYFVSNFSAGYTFDKTPLGSINLQVFVNNLLNKEYVANGWSGTGIYDGFKSDYAGYYPQATRNFTARLTVSF